MKCNQCQQNEAIIHIKESGDFCLSCHNQIMTKHLGIAAVDPCEMVVSLKDPQGNDHTFEISLLLLPGIAIWRGWEIDGGYEFETQSRPEDNQAFAYLQLIQKIAKGLAQKTLVRYSENQPISNAIHLSDGQYGLNSVGTGRITLDEESRDLASLVIDGQVVSIEAFGQALTCYEGATLVFQIQDQSEPVLEQGMVLQPLSIDPEQIYQHFERTLSWFLDKGFLSYKRVSACGDALTDSVSELKRLLCYGDQETARKLGQRMKERLISIENDDDYFPNHLIEMINATLSLNQT